jgi:branched-chain amino acid transport system substrate-binding protein
MQTTRRRLLGAILIAAAPDALARGAVAQPAAAPQASPSAALPVPAVAPVVSAPVVSAPADSLPIGALFPLSGNLSLLGDESFRGLELATDARNAAGGLFKRPIRLVRGDASDPGQATSEAHRLMAAEHVPAIFSSLPSGLALSASQQTELAGIPLFELGASADAITDRGFKYLYRSCPPASRIASVSIDAVTAVLAPLWRVKAERLRLVLLHQDTLNATALATQQEQLARARGCMVADNVSYTSGSADMSPTIQRMRAANADVVLHIGNSDDIVQLYRGMAKLGWKPRMIVGAAPDYSLGDTMQMVGAGLGGTMNVDVTQYRVNPAIAPGAAQVAAAYQTKYGAPPRSGQSLASYAGAQIFFDALARAGSADKDRVRACVLATDIPPGGTPAGWGAKFDDKGQNTLAMPFIMQWQNALQTTIFPPDAAVAPALANLGS